MSTSLDLLKRAVESSMGKTISIKGDPDFQPFARAATRGSLFMLSIDVRRIVAGILNTATPGNKDAAHAADAIRVATNGDHILSLDAGSEPDGRSHGHLFIPIDYARLAKMVAQSQN